MAGIIKLIKSILTYTGPGNGNSQFELKEDGNEGNDVESAQEAAPEGSRAGAKRKSVFHGKAIRLSLNQQDTVSCELHANMNQIKARFNYPRNQDVLVREFRIGKKTKAFMVFLDEMVDRKILNRDVLPSLMSKDSFADMDQEDLITYIIESVLTVSSVSRENRFDIITDQIIGGKTAVFIEGREECLLIHTKGFEKRAVDKPVTEAVIMGSQEGFTENLATNISLIRRIIRSENLITEVYMVGRVNKINCAILYMDTLANPELVNEIKQRLRDMDMDYIIGVGMVEQFLEDSTWTLFPQVLNTERPDRTASFLMDGQVVLITDGTPFAQAVPVTFFQLLHTSEDSFLRWPYGTFLRIIRLSGILIASLLPGLYVALVLYHQEMIPTELLSSIARSKEEVPFPTIVEILMMELSFELIREGGIRIPGVIGQTLGIIGALILGQAAVAAGLVSPILIIIVSVTGLGSFAIPNYSLSLGVRILRFVFICFGSIAGFYGISAALVLTGGFLCSIKSFGVPFLSPVAPASKSNRDLILRNPVWLQKIRPDYLNTQNRKKGK